MTKAEYIASYRAARKGAAKISAKAIIEIKQAYTTAGNLVAEQIRQAEMLGASQITQQSLARISEQLSQASQTVQEAITKQTPIAIGKVAQSVTSIDSDYVIESVKKAGISMESAKIINIGVGINKAIIANLTNRIWEDGYTFSERVWRVGEACRVDMNRVLSAGLAQGRDPIKIAQDLEKYISDGKQVLMKRYGKLEAGTVEFAKRIPRNVDYRAVRLVRTELYRSLKETDVAAGLANPAAYDSFDWIMQAGRADWDCACPDYAHNSPYTAAQVPIQPHPNCQCYLQPRLRDNDDFVADLVRWSNGENVDYLDDWKANYYNGA